MKRVRFGKIGTIQHLYFCTDVARILEQVKSSFKILFYLQRTLKYQEKELMCEVLDIVTMVCDQ